MDQKLKWHAWFCGSAAGLADAVVNYPFIAWRFMYQSQQPLSINPRIVYQGVTQYAFGIIPTTAIQCGIHHFFNQFSDHGVAQLLSAILGGFGGALFSTPSEHLILSQQKSQSGPIKTIKAINLHYGWQRLWTGYFPKGMRDGGYTVAMFWGHDAVNQWLEKRTKQTDWMILSGIISGTIGAIFTQPFDVIATRKQCQAQPEAVIDIAKHIFKSTGVRGFFPGFWFRTGAVVSGVIVMKKARHEAEKALVHISKPGRSTI